MASGTPIQILDIYYPATLFAQLVTRAGGSTLAERIRFHDFDAATIEYVDYLCRLQGYAGGGLTFTIAWAAASATTGVTRWGLAVRRIQDDAEDVDASHTYDFNVLDATTASASGEIAYDTITFTDGADMDSWANGELAIVRIRREASHANDTMTGDAELLSLTGVET